MLNRGHSPVPGSFYHPGGIPFLKKIRKSETVTLGMYSACWGRVHRKSGRRKHCRTVAFILAKPCIFSG